MAKMNELVIAGMNFTCVLVAVAEYQMPEKECLLNLLAKALGYGIILGSTILKLPQILVIIRSNSIEGLSVPSFEIECIGYTISVGYCLFKKVPFTAYGELFFLLLQSLILMFLIYSHLPNQASTTWIKVGISCPKHPCAVRPSRTVSRCPAATRTACPSALPYCHARPCCPRAAPAPHATAAREQPLPRAPLLPACSPCPARPCCLRAAPAPRATAACEKPLPLVPLLPVSSPCPERPFCPPAAPVPARPVCRVCPRPAPVRAPLLPCASRPAAARMSRSAAPHVAPFCSPRVAPCFPAQRVPCCPRRPARAALPNPSRPAARATAAAGEGAAGSAGGAAAQPHRAALLLLLLLLLLVLTRPAEPDPPRPSSRARHVPSSHAARPTSSRAARLVGSRWLDFFQTFPPTPKMTTLRVLLHVAAQKDYELHSLNFSTTFLQGSLHEEIWLRRPPGFTGSFPAGT
ncbi:unnamed protein product [Closterium sp. NIES-53]